MSKHAFHDHLKMVPMFSGLDGHELDEIGTHTTELSFHDGQVLMAEGGVALEMCIILEGRVSITMGGEQLTTLGAGDFVGELGLLTQRERSATVTADGPVTVLHIDGRGFSSMLHEVPQIAVKMLPIVAARAADNAAAAAAD